MRPTRDGEEFSPSSLGAMVLFMQQPTDRALRGWQPFGVGGDSYIGGTSEENIRWAASRIRLTSAEWLALYGDEEDRRLLAEVTRERDDMDDF